MKMYAAMKTFKLCENIRHFDSIIPLYTTEVSEKVAKFQIFLKPFPSMKIVVKTSRIRKKIAKC